MVGGFANWRTKPRDCQIVGAMLDSIHSVMEKHDLANRYLLAGYYEGDFFYADILWVDGSQPVLIRLDHESVWRRD